VSSLPHDGSLHQGLCHNLVYESTRRLIWLIVGWLSPALHCIFILPGAKIIPFVLAELSVMKCSGIIIQLSFKTVAKSLQRNQVESNQDRFPFRTARSLQEFFTHNAIYVDSIDQSVIPVFLLVVGSLVVDSQKGCRSDPFLRNCVV
jgi:hypothetical protein